MELKEEKRNAVKYFIGFVNFTSISRFLIAENNLRRFFNLNSYCGVVTLFVAILVLIVLSCVLVSTATTASNEKSFRILQDEIKKRIPRKKSIVNLRPAYDCIHKHLQQTDLFQGKSQKMLRKELLEIEIMNSRISCVNKLLKPETQSEWRRSRLPKPYHRTINSSSMR